MIVLSLVGNYEQGREQHLATIALHTEDSTKDLIQKLNQQKFGPIIESSGVELTENARTMRLAIVNLYRNSPNPKQFDEFTKALLDDNSFNAALKAIYEKGDPTQ